MIGNGFRADSGSPVRVQKRSTKSGGGVAVSAPKVTASAIAHASSRSTVAWTAGGAPHLFIAANGR